jgi:hypothetical protein
MNDETLLRTVKNGLMIAGHEMGPVGDHWPAIQAIIRGCEEDLYTIQANEAVVGELEFHIADALRKIEEVLPEVAPENRKYVSQFVKQMWEEYYAIMEPVDAKLEPKINEAFDENDESFPSLRAAAHVIRTMGGRT